MFIMNTKQKLQPTQTDIPEFILVTVVYAIYIAFLIRIIYIIIYG